MMGGVTDTGYNIRREAETAKAQNNPPSPRFCLIAFSRLRSPLRLTACKCTTRSAFSISISAISAAQRSNNWLDTVAFAGRFNAIK